MDMDKVLYQLRKIKAPEEQACMWEAGRIAQIGIQALPQENLVKAVRDQFRSEGLETYDLYPPLHGAGLAEAENPYPDETTQRCFAAVMRFNTDISLFGAPGNSNRIEAGYILTDDGCKSITPFVDDYCEI